MNRRRRRIQRGDILLVLAFLTLYAIFWLQYGVHR
jgi:hypothetical protein